jgi:hypothetical protein
VNGDASACSKLLQSLRASAAVQMAGTTIRPLHANSCCPCFRVPRRQRGTQISGQIVEVRTFEEKQVCDGATKMAEAGFLSAKAALSQGGSTSRGRRSVHPSTPTSQTC